MFDCEREFREVAVDGDSVELLFGFAHAAGGPVHDTLFGTPTLTDTSRPATWHHRAG